MGIRFYCPNGHKMNVKEFQAGQRGICPVCGVKMRIPLESTRLSSRQKKSPSPTTAPEPNPTLPNATANRPSSAATVFVASPEVNPLAATVFAASPENDPLEAAGNAVWYIQSSGGGQLGPTTSEVVRNWLAEGRLTASNLVWREGWSEWKNAGDVFPQLSPKLTIPGLEALLGEPVATPGLGLASNSHSPPRKIQRIAWGALAIVVLILIVAFLVIWIKQ